MTTCAVRMLSGITVAALLAMSAHGQATDSAAQAAPEPKQATPPAPGLPKSDVKILGPGDPAPSLDGIQQVTGEPLTKFEPGTIYVLDMWATWCSPCIKAIPHMSEIAEKYKDKGVKVYGVAIWETERPARDGTLFDRVKRFAESNKEIKYPIAYAGENIEFAMRWMNATDRKTIPTVFIINKDGKFAWMGHPNMGMDQALERIVAGNYDPVEEERLAKEREDKRQRGMRMAVKMQQRVQNKDWEAAQEIMSNIVDVDPEMFAPTAVARMRVLVAEMKDAPRADEWARSCLDRYRNSAYVLREIAHYINTAPEGYQKDAALSLELARAAEKVAKKEDSRTFVILGESLAASGDVEGAKAVLLAAMKDADNLGKEELQKQLDKMK